MGEWGADKDNMAWPTGGTSVKFAAVSLVISQKFTFNS